MNYVQHLDSHRVTLISVFFVVNALLIEASLSSVDGTVLRLLLWLGILNAAVWFVLMSRNDLYLREDERIAAELEERLVPEHYRFYARTTRKGVTRHSPKVMENKKGVFWKIRTRYVMLTVMAGAGILWALALLKATGWIG